MKKTNVAIVGYGNVGNFALEAVLAAADMELKGIVEIKAFVEKVESGDGFKELRGIKIVDDISKFDGVDVAILCVPSRMVKETAEKYLAMGINTVDGFDIHTSIVETRRSLDETAKKHGRVAITAAGWDPGSDSIVRALFEVCAPKGITYTNFGPGMSMGHTVAAKSIEGVKAALSITMPVGAGIHRRMVYVEIENGFDFDSVAAAIKSDDYFSHDETHVIKVDDVDAVIDRGHGVNMIRKGVSGATDNQLFEFNMKINNPALTSQILIACARAAMRQSAGAYTLIEIPVIDLIEGDKEEAIRKLV